MRWLKGIFLALIMLVVVLFGILFAIRNQHVIPLDLVWIELPSASLALWLLLSLVLGFLLGLLAMSGVCVHLKTSLGRAKRQLTAKQSSTTAQRQVPQGLS